MSFKFNFSFEERSQESFRVTEKYPDRVPVICEKSKIASYDCPDIDKKKYLVPKDLTIGQFIYVIKKRLKLSNDKALFLFVNNSIAPSAESMNILYRRHKDIDNFLYVTYSLENVFG